MMPVDTAHAFLATVHSRQQTVYIRLQVAHARLADVSRSWTCGSPSMHPVHRDLAARFPQLATVQPELMVAYG